MPFCEKCGKQIKDGDRFCEHCGAKVKSLPMTSVNEKSTDIKLDKKSNKKLVVIISVASAVAVVLAVCAIVFVPKIFGNNNAEQTVEVTTQQVTTEIPTTAEPTTVEPTTDVPTTTKPTTIEPTTVKPTEPEDGENNSSGGERCYFNGFSIEVPDDYTYEVDGDKVTFYESYNHEHPETGSDGFLLAIDWTYDGTVSIDSSRLGSKDGKYFMYIHPTGFGMLEDEYANQRMVDARAETEDVLSSFRIE